MVRQILRHQIGPAPIGSRALCSDSALQKSLIVNLWSWQQNYERKSAARLTRHEVFKLWSCLSSDLAGWWVRQHWHCMSRGE